jgi:hypothetical protein
VGVRGTLRRLERNASEDLESFELLDGTTYYYNHLNSYKVLFLHACDLQLGRGEWPEPPEVYRKICEARDLTEVLERFKPENPQSAFVNLAELYDTDALQRLAVTLNHRTLRLHERLLPNRQIRSIGRGMKEQAHTCSR